MDLSKKFIVPPLVINARVASSGSVEKVRCAASIDERVAAVDAVEKVRWPLFVKRICRALFVNLIVPVEAVTKCCRRPPNYS